MSAALRYELGDAHTYDYVEGVIPCPIAPGKLRSGLACLRLDLYLSFIWTNTEEALLEIDSYFPPTDAYFGYFDPSEPLTFYKALDDLETFITTEGPFHGVLAYSHGAQLAASLMARMHRETPSRQPFKCAVFLSGGIPYATSKFPDGKLRHLDPAKDGVVIEIPTANIWGSNDALYPGTSEILSELCRSEWNATFRHEEGHGIPGAKARVALIGSVRAIRRTVDRALSIQ